MKHYLHLYLSLLIFFSGTTFGAKKVLDKSVAIVNDEVILASDIDKFQQKIRSKSYQELFGAVDPRAVTNRDVALQMLIEEKIINQQVKKLDLTVTDQELDAQLKVIQKRNGISPDQLQARLKMLGATMQEYREGIRRQIERRNLVEREIKPNLEISDEQLRHFYLRNFKPDTSEKQYKIAHLFFDGKQPNAAERAKEVYKQLSGKPETFETMVKEVSDDKDTAENGGLLGYFKPDQLSKELRAVVPKTPVGQVSQPIKVANGYHIIKVLEASSLDFNTLSKDQKEILRNQMVGEELERKMALWVERRKAESYVRVTSK